MFDKPEGIDTGRTQKMVCIANFSEQPVLKVTITQQQEQNSKQQKALPLHVSEPPGRA
jgi:hypothetical protein